MKYLAALATCLFLAGSVYASPISATNVRPVTIDGPSAGEDSVQTILDNSFGSGQYDDTDDQMNGGYFKVAKAISKAIVPQLVLRNDSNLKLGIFSLPDFNDASSVVRAELFDASASDGDVILVKWVSDYAITIGASSTEYAINRFGFGFYAEDASGKIFYTLDDLNGGGSAQALAINNGTDNEWTFFFESNSDRENDFNEAVLFVESITPIPEPGTLALFGVGAIVAFVIRRRRQS